MFLVCSDKHYMIILQLINRIDINTPGTFSRKNSKLRNLKKNAQIKKKNAETNYIFIRRRQINFLLYGQ